MSIGKLAFFHNPPKPNDIFRIVSIEMLPEKRSAIVTYQIIGLDKIITKNLAEVYETDIDAFSKHDAKYIGFLYGKLNNSTQELLRLLPANSNSAPISFTPAVFLLGIISTSLLVLSNLVGPKIITFANYEFNAGLLFFPAILITSDITTEVYGFRASRLIIWLAFLGNIIITIGTNIIVTLPHAQIWQDQGAYEIVFNSSARTLYQFSFLNYLNEFRETHLYAAINIALRRLALKFICLI